MIREEMMQRMSAREYLEWMAFDEMQTGASRPAQTPDEILRMFKPTRTHGRRR